MTLRSRHLGFSLLLGALGLGCSSEPDNIGDGDLAIDKNRLESYAATWDGYVEAYQFQSGSDRVRIEIDANGQGWLRVGDGELLEPPTDPDIGYPEALREAHEYEGVVQELYDGVLYSLQNTQVESERVRFDFNPLSAFVEWCGLQSPIAVTALSVAPSGYMCMPNPGFSGPNEGECTVWDGSGPETPIDCGKAVICLNACQCDATSCTGNDVPQYANLVDAALDDSGETLEGTLLIIPAGTLDAESRTLKLTRQ